MSNNFVVVIELEFLVVTIIVFSSSIFVFIMSSFIAIVNLLCFITKRNSIMKINIQLILTLIVTLDCIK